MKNSRLVAAIAGLAFFCTALTANAAVVKQVNSSYASGAVFSGQVTFLNDYSNVTAVDGYLTGASYGNDHINWIWYPSNNFASSFGSQYGGNFLMDGSPSGGYTNFITFTWDRSDPSNLVFATPGSILGPNGGNNVNYTDPLVSGTIGTISNVPEPASLALVGLGLAGVAFARRRKSA